MISKSSSSPAKTVPKRVVFSDSAWLGVIAETYERISTETGGILLGVIEEGTWYVIESIDPGPNSIFTPSYFEYDRPYTEHLVHKIRRIYKTEISVLGLWHRHPGGFDSFSPTDNDTNLLFAKLNPQGAISGLVNIDPDFRFSLFHVTTSLEYSKISVEQGNGKIPKEYMEHKKVSDFNHDTFSKNRKKMVLFDFSRPSTIEPVGDSVDNAFSISKGIKKIFTTPLFGTGNNENKFGNHQASIDLKSEQLESGDIHDRLISMVDQELERYLGRQDQYESEIALEGETVRISIKNKHHINSGNMDVIFAINNGRKVVRINKKEEEYFPGILQKLVLKNVR